MNTNLKLPIGLLIVSLLIGCDTASEENEAREICLASLGEVDTTGSFEQRWTSLAALNTPHQFHDVVATNGKLYAVGGTQPRSREVSAFEEYDPQRDSWVVLENMPTPRHFLAAAAEERTIYAIGGLGEDTSGDSLIFFYQTVEAYNIDEQRWTQTADLPTPRNRLDAISFDGLIYVIGGLADEVGDTGIVEVYDPATDQWTRKADMPTPRHGHAIVVVGDELLVMGGFSGIAGGVVATVEAYNPATDTWSSRADMPTARGFLGAAEAEGYVYAIAGRYQNETNPVERYNPCLDEWTALGSMPGAFRNRFGAAAIDNQIYVVGGELSSDEQLPRSLERYAP